MRMMKKRLGDILLERGWVDGPQLDSALNHQRQWGVPLGQVLVDLRLCTSRLVLEALAQQSGVPTLDLDTEPLDCALAQRMPRPLAERHRVVPLRLEGPQNNVLVVAIAAPASLHALEAVRQVMNPSKVIPRLATDAAISRALERLYFSHVTLRPSAPRARPEEDEPFFAPDPSPAAGTNERLAVVLGTACEEDGGEVILLSESEIVHDKTLLSSRTPREEAPPGEVLIYGWGGAAEAMTRALRGAGFRASVVETQRVLTAGETEVVLLPLPWLEALARQPRARLLVAGKGLGDRIKAQLLGACGFLMAPVETDVLLHAVEQLVRTVQ